MEFLKAAFWDRYCFYYIPVNDLPNVTQNTDTRIYLYADDAKIYRSITCENFVPSG